MRSVTQERIGKAFAEIDKGIRKVAPHDYQLLVLMQCFNLLCAALLEIAAAIREARHDRASGS